MGARDGAARVQKPSPSDAIAQRNRLSTEYGYRALVETKTKRRDNGKSDNRPETRMERGFPILYYQYAK